MIIDKIDNRERYFPLNKRIEKSLRYIAVTDFSKLSDGVYEIEGRTIFAIISRYNLKDEKKSNLELHKRYIDVQFMFEGNEQIAFSNNSKDKLSINGYDEDNDIEFVTGNGDKLSLNCGNFAIFFPNELHQPGIGNTEDKVTKVVVKIDTEE